MSLKKHFYEIKNTWTGNTGTGTSTYTSYERDHKINIPQKEEMHLSADPSFRGNAAKYNPEELLVASLSSCHMLWYLHLCASHGIKVLEYQDKATGMMVEKADGSGQFEEVILNPTITIEDGEHYDLAIKLHHDANKKCFIANSCNFKVAHHPEILIK